MSEVIKYRLATEIQDHITRELAFAEYTVGQAERDDMAVDFVETVLSQQVEPPSLAYDGLNYWYRIFGSGVQGERT